MSGDVSSGSRRLPRTEDLLARANGGDEAALEALFGQYRTYLAAKLRIDALVPRRMRRRVDEHELLHDAFVGAWQRLRDFRYQGEGSFRRWLYRVLRNEIIDRLRREGAQSRSPEYETEPIRPVEESTGAVPSPSANLRETELKEAIHLALGGLSKIEQEIVVMRDFEKHAWPEICGILSCADSTARRRYQQAHLQLARALKDFDPDVDG